MFWTKFNDFNRLRITNNDGWFTDGFDYLTELQYNHYVFKDNTGHTDVFWWYYIVKTFFILFLAFLPAFFPFYYFFLCYSLTYRVADTVMIHDWLFMSFYTTDTDSIGVPNPFFMFYSIFIYSLLSLFPFFQFRAVLFPHGEHDVLVGLACDSAVTTDDYLGVQSAYFPVLYWAEPTYHHRVNWDYPWSHVSLRFDSTREHLVFLETWQFWEHIWFTSRFPWFNFDDHVWEARTQDDPPFFDLQGMPEEPRRPVYPKMWIDMHNHVVPIQKQLYMRTGSHFIDGIAAFKDKDRS